MYNQQSNSNVAEKKEIKYNGHIAIPSVVLHYRILQLTTRDNDVNTAADNETTNLRKVENEKKTF